MRSHSSRRGSSTSESSSTSQISPKTAEHPKKKRSGVPQPSGSPTFGSIKKRQASEIGGDEDVDSTHHLEHSSESTLNVCICQPDPKIPRPRNAFILYRQHHQPGIIAQHPGLTAPQISKIVGEQWRRQPNEIKIEWKKRAEEVKVRHQIQYPDYRYTPRRSNRRGSTLESPALVTPSLPCGKCGGRSTRSPTSPTPNDNLKGMLPPITPASAHPDAHGRCLPPMHNLSIMSPHPSRTPGHPGPIPGVSYPGFRQATDEERGISSPPDNKRRRFNNGGHFFNNRQSMSIPYTTGSPYREVFVRTDSIPNRQQLTPGFMGPPPRPTAMQVQAQRIRGMSLTPLRVGDQSQSVEAMVMSMPYIGKIVTLSRISPPHQLDNPRSLTPRVRGAVIAVEGDNQEAVSEVVKWLGETLGHMPEYCVRTAQGPKLPELGRDLLISDYLSLMTDWHPKSREIISFITNAPVAQEADAQSNETTMSPPNLKNEGCIPIVLLERYQLFASNTFACKIPITDNYSPIDHWQWMATLWRDTVGPDVTVYIKDENGDDDADVEVKKDVKCITVKRKKTLGAERSKLGEAELRRLAFEIGEWARLLGKAKEHTVKSLRDTKDEV